MSTDISENVDVGFLDLLTEPLTIQDPQTIFASAVGIFIMVAFVIAGLRLHSKSKDEALEFLAQTNLYYIFCVIAIVLLFLTGASMITNALGFQSNAESIITMDNGVIVIILILTIIQVFFVSVIGCKNNRVYLYFKDHQRNFTYGIIFGSLFTVVFIPFAAIRIWPMRMYFAFTGMYCNILKYIQYI